MRLLTALALLFALPYPYQAHACGKTSAPEDVVQAQVDAYNAHDVEAFARCYADDITIRDLSSDAPPIRGISELKKAYDWLAKAPPGFRVEVVRRITSGRVVIDHERIHGLPKERGTPEATAVFEVRDGKIRNVWFPPSD